MLHWNPRSNQPLLFSSSYPPFPRYTLRAEPTSSRWAAPRPRTARVAAAADTPCTRPKRCWARTWCGTSGASAVSTATSRSTRPTWTTPRTERSTAEAATAGTTAHVASASASAPERSRWPKLPNHILPLKNPLQQSWFYFTLLLQTLFYIRYNYQRKKSPNVFFKAFHARRRQRQWRDEPFYSAKHFPLSTNPSKNRSHFVAYRSSKSLTNQPEV